MKTDLNRANRQCCDVDIRNYKTNEPWMFIDFCNTTTAGFSGDSSHATIKGANAITFYNPIAGTMKITFHCHPFKIYSLLSDGTMESTAILPEKKTINCTVAGEISLPAEETPIVGSVFVYAEGDYAGTCIKGTYADSKFTAEESSNISVGSSYEIGYLISKTTGVRKVSFNDKKTPKDYRVTQKTLDKDENGDLIPLLMTAYKATPKRNIELNFSSTGDPAEVSIEFDCSTDRDGNVLDIVEIVE